jgi:predicted ribosome quality control (RQC) complex YloA/Tae2 family protein
LLWRTEAAGRARRNTATVLGDLAGRRIAAVRVADRDRYFFFDLEGGGAVVTLPFGPRPNVLLTDAGGLVVDAFLRVAEWVGRPAPIPRPAEWPTTGQELRDRWREAGAVADALARAVPTLGRLHAMEAASRCEVDPAAPASAVSDWARLLRAASDVDREAAAAPRPHLYWAGRLPEGVSLVPLSRAPEGWERRVCATADEAARAWAARTLAAEGFLRAYRPLEATLAAAARRLADSAKAMAGELARPSRADRHEHEAHLLMAQPDGRRSGLERIVAPDIIAGPGAPSAEIALDPRLTIVENAERLYQRARQARAAREHAAGRHEVVAADALRATALLEELRALAAAGATAKAVDAWRLEHAPDLARYRRAGEAGEERLPYRRFELAGGWEVRVGRGARDNAELTAHHASPHDLWLHARGVPGSHVVLRRPARTSKPGRDVIEAAAALAAYHSKARGQSLVPVIVAERKYVRLVKGGAPGLARVEREEVVLVEPRAI